MIESGGRGKLELDEDGVDTWANMNPELVRKELKMACPNIMTISIQVTS